MVSMRERYEDGIHIETWCDDCGMHDVRVIDEMDNVRAHVHCEGYGVASIGGTAGAVSVFFTKPMTEEEAQAQLARLKDEYEGTIQSEFLSIWNGTLTRAK